jgi:hypothetical protein
MFLIRCKSKVTSRRERERESREQQMLQADSSQARSRLILWVSLDHEILMTIIFVCFYEISSRYIYPRVHTWLLMGFDSCNTESQHVMIITRMISRAGRPRHPQRPRERERERVMFARSIRRHESFDDIRSHRYLFYCWSSLIALDFSANSSMLAVHRLSTACLLASKKAIWLNVR